MRNYFEVYNKKTNEEETLAYFDNFIALKDYFKATDFEPVLIDEETIKDLYEKCFVVLQEYYSSNNTIECAKEFFPAKTLNNYDELYYDNIGKLLTLLKAMHIINKSEDIKFIYSEI